MEIRAEQPGARGSEEAWAEGTFPKVGKFSWQLWKEKKWDRDPVDIPVGTRQSANQHLAVPSAPVEYGTL